MKNKSNKKIISAIAILLTVVVLQISGGSTILVTLLGGSGIVFLPRMFQLKNIKKEKINHTISTINKEYSNNNLSYVLNNQEFCLNETNFYHESMKFEDTRIMTENKENNKDEHISLIQEIETTPQLTQQENINRLVRKRKKEPINRFKRNNM